MAKKRSPIPKKVAGFRIPKSLRKSKTLRSLLNSPTGRTIVAEALTAGAAAAAAVLVKEREHIAEAAHAGAEKGTQAVSLVSEALHDARTAVIGVIANAARSAISEHRPRNEHRPRKGKVDDEVRH